MKATKRNCKRLISATALGAALLGVVANPAAAAPRGAATCSYDAPSGELLIEAGNPKTIAVAVGREGEAVKAWDTTGSGRRPIGCGAEPAVDEVETIVIDGSGAFISHAVTVDLEGGPLAPGRTDEADGSSEIELDVTIPQRGRYPDSSLRVIGSDGGDHLALGPVGNDTAFNLNGAEASPDLDLVVHQRLDSRPSSQIDVQIVALEGDDIVDAGGGPLFDGPMDLGFGDLTVNAAEGTDTVIGGYSSDRIDGGDDDDAINGGSGSDTLKGGDGDDTIESADGRNSINGGRGADVITGGAGRDYARGGKGSDQITTAAGNDTVYADDGKDTVDGGEDDDRIDGDAGRDTLEGGDGNDRISGERGRDLLSGGEGDDRLEGDISWRRRGFADELVGGPGEDLLRGWGGKDLIDARDGFVDRINCDRTRDVIDADADDKLRRCKRG